MVGATTIAAIVTDPKAFRSGRDFAAWIGLVPRQDSTGGKPKLGRISKQEDSKTLPDEREAHQRPSPPHAQRDAVRKFGDKTRHDYIRHVEAFAGFLGRSPDTATAEGVRRLLIARPRAERP